MSAYDTLLAWSMSLMMTWASPAKLYPGNEIKQQEHAETYKEKAADAITIVYGEQGTIFGGSWSKAMDLALMLKIIAEEHKYIEKPGGVPEPKGGRSWCLMSLNIGSGKTIEGWTGPELDADRKKCFLSGYHAMKRSFGACRHLPMQFGLSVYNSGACSDTDTTSSKRIYDAIYRVNKTVPKDEEVLAELAKIK